jgi:hypothetical protein
MALIMRRLVLGTFLMGGLVWAGAASADPDNLHEYLHQSSAVSPVHWGGVAENSMMLRSMQANEAAAAQRTNGPAPIATGFLPRFMQATRISTPIAPKTQGFRGRIRALGRRLAGKIRPRSGLSGGSLKQQLGGGEARGASSGSSSSSGAAPNFGAIH